jgi:hypothetical protein
MVCSLEQKIAPPPSPPKKNVDSAVFGVLGESNMERREEKENKEEKKKDEMKIIKKNRLKYTQK